MDLVMGTKALSVLKPYRVPPKGDRYLVLHQTYNIFSFLPPCDLPKSQEAGSFVFLKLRTDEQTVCTPSFVLKARRHFTKCVFVF